MVINWPNFNIVESQGIKRPEERERDRGTANEWSSQNTRRYLSLKFTFFCVCGSWHPKTITIVTSKITDLRSP